MQWAHFVALIGTLERHSGQSFVVGSAGAGAFFKRFICLITMKMAKATMTKSSTLFRNRPILIVAAPASCAAAKVS